MVSRAGYLKRRWGEYLENRDKAGQSALLVYEDRTRSFEILITANEDALPMLIISPPAKHLKPLKRASLHGLEILNQEIEVEGRNREEFVCLICRDSSFHFTDLFFHFGDDLCDSMAKAVSTSSIEEVVRASIERWKYFWSPVPSSLTPEEVKGLLGELYLLQRGISKCGPEFVAFWTGPERMDHDFQGGGIGVEVKATETVPPKIQINNLRQLDHRFFDDLFICICHLTTCEHGGRSLISLVSEIETQLEGHVDSVEMFRRKIAAAGYRPNRTQGPESQEYRILPRLDLYRVDDSFPSLTEESFKAPLDRRVHSIKYLLEVSGLNPLPESEFDNIFSRIAK